MSLHFAVEKLNTTWKNLITAYLIKQMHTQMNNGKEKNVLQLNRHWSTCSTLLCTSLLIFNTSKLCAYGNEVPTSLLAKTRYDCASHMTQVITLHGGDVTNFENGMLHSNEKECEKISTTKLPSFTAYPPLRLSDETQFQMMK
ncbi:CLUMA_CG008848, isoform A [Clunio marinus]|uniref:CLUMA_CG008848, isoform A n=1 Tax=Clunio marinus TaxID=568069 RepID=A0A1J1I4D3_9DIPT|nr:CLUMA_CG008848, isoform A [Clunio marinus]